MEQISKFDVSFHPVNPTACQNKFCNFIGVSVQKLLAHYYQCHRNDKEFNSPCLFSKDCFHQQNFKSYHGLKSHLTRYHPTFNNVAGVNPTNLVEQVSTFQESDCDNNFQYSETCYMNPSTSVEEKSQEAGNKLLQLL